MRIVEGVAHVEDVEDFVAALDRIGEAHGCAVQAFDARRIVGRAHLATAVARADRAFDRGENVARDRAVEILLYAAGRRQIDQALELGVAAGETPAAVVVHAPDGTAGGGGDEAAAAEAVGELLGPGATLEETDERAVREFFGVGDAELAATDAALDDLVLERVALLDVEK